MVTSISREVWITGLYLQLQAILQQIMEVPSHHKLLVGNNVYVVWSDNSTGNGDIYFKRSMDNGDIDRRKFVIKNNGSSISPQITELETMCM